MTSSTSQYDILHNMAPAGVWNLLGLLQAPAVLHLHIMDVSPDYQLHHESPADVSEEHKRPLIWEQALYTPSKHTFSAVTDSMMSERCSEMTSCHFSTGPGLLMLTLSNLPHMRMSRSEHPTAEYTAKRSYSMPTYHLTCLWRSEREGQLLSARRRVSLTSRGS